MFKVKKLTWVIGCAFALNGCALPFQSKVISVNNMEVKPVERVSYTGYKPKIMYLLGRYYQGKIQYEKAIDAYHKALAGNEGYVEVRNGLGVIYAIQGQFDKAYEHFSKAIELAPMESYLHNNLGYAYLIQGKEFEATEALKMALQINPNNKQARMNLATAFNRLGLHEDALALNIMPDSKILHTDIIDPGVGTQQPQSDPELVHVAPNVYEYHEAKQSNKLYSDSNSSLSTTGSSLKKKNLINSDLKDISIEVSNGNGITGMARQVSYFLVQYGAAGMRLTNHQTYQQPETEIYYRSGSQQQANQLSNVLPKPVKIIESEELRSDIQVKILLGIDYSHELAFFNHDKEMHSSLSGYNIARK